MYVHTLQYPIIIIILYWSYQSSWLLTAKYVKLTRINSNIKAHEIQTLFYMVILCGCYRTVKNNGLKKKNVENNPVKQKTMI